MFWKHFNLRVKSAWWLLALALVVIGCAKSEPEKITPPKTIGDWFSIRVGDRTVQMQIALTEAEMEHGLMERAKLGADQGMLFVFREPTQMGFWMHDTPLPLDVGFFSPDGTLKEIYAMQPFDDTPIRSRDMHLQFALEMNQGWFHQRGVKPGARLDMAAVLAAIKARGMSPEDFGLR